MTSPPRTARGQATPTRTSPAPGLHLTAPGAVLVILVPTVLGGLLDGLFSSGYGILTGLTFTAGCLAAALKTRPRDLLLVAVAPPVLFVAAVAIAETIRSWSSDGWLRNEVVAITIALAGDAFWIVAGTVITAVLAAARWSARKPHPRAAGQRSAVSAARKS